MTYEFREHSQLMRAAAEEIERLNKLMAEIMNHPVVGSTPLWVTLGLKEPYVQATLKAMGLPQSQPVK